MNLKLQHPPGQPTGILLLSVSRGGEFEPCLARVGSLNQKGHVFGIQVFYLLTWRCLEVVFTFLSIGSEEMVYKVWILKLGHCSWVGHLIPILFPNLRWNFTQGCVLKLWIDLHISRDKVCMPWIKSNAFIHAKKKSSWWAQRRQEKKPNIFWKSIFHISMHLFRYRSQIAQITQITQIAQIRQITQITDHTDHIFGKTKLWCLLWSITELTHPNMEFLCFT